MQWIKRFVTKRWMYSTIFVVVAIIATSVIYQKTHSTKIPQYVTAAAKLGNVNQVIDVTGTVQAVTDIGLDFGSTGLVSAVNVTPGQSVQAGQVMAVLDTSSLRAQVAQAAANVTAAQARLATDEGGPTASVQQSTQAQIATAQNNLNAANHALTDTEAANQISLLAAQVAINQAQTTLQDDQTTLVANQQSFANYQKLVIPTSNATTTPVPLQTSPTSYDIPTTQNTIASDESYIPVDQQSQSEAQSDLTFCGTPCSVSATYQSWVNADSTAISSATQAIAEANKVIGDLNQIQVDENNLTATQVKATQSQDSAQAAVDAATTALANANSAASIASTPATASQIQSDQASLSAAQATLASAQTNLSNAEIIAPVSGIVAQVNISVGKTPSSGAANSGTVTGDIVLESPSSFEVIGQVSDTQIAQVHTGQQALVIPAGQSSPLSAKVSQITPMATITQGVPAYPVDVLIDQSSSNLFSGASAQVEIVVKEVSSVLTVPTSAIHTLGSRNYVTILEAGKPVRKLVTLGATGGLITEITSGLQLGDQVVLANRNAVLPSTTFTNKKGGATGFGGAGGFVGKRSGGVGGLRG